MGFFKKFFKNKKSSENKIVPDDIVQISNISISKKITQHDSKIINKDKDKSNSNKTKTNNYKIAAMLRCCQGGKKIGKTSDDYPRYLSYEYEIYEPIKFQKELIEAGFLIECSTETALKRLKIAELKKLLLNNNLSEKGKKADLIQRLVENTNIEELCIEKLYIPSEKGAEHLEKYSYVFSLSSYSITTTQYEIYTKKYPYLTKPKDIIWQILNDQYNKYSLEKDYGLARDVLLYRAEILLSENKITDALFYFISVLYYDVTGLGNGDEIDSADMVFISPGISDAIYKYKEYFQERMINRCYEIYQLPHYYLSMENFRCLVHDILSGVSIDKEKYFSI